MTDFVLDASAVLALLHDEPGAARVREVMEEATISSVNVAEVAAKFADRGMPARHVRTVIGALDLDVSPFDADQAFLAGELRAKTKSAGLSLGDRSCLALAIALGVPAVTTDRAWSELDHGATVEQLR